MFDCYQAIVRGRVATLRRMGVWSRNRFKDLAEDYGLCENTGRRVVYKKLQQILGMRAAWPMYATHKEDLKFRSDAMRAQ